MAKSVNKCCPIASLLVLTYQVHAANTSAAAIDACACMKPIYDVMPQMQAQAMAAMQSGDQSGMQTFQNKMMEMQQSSDQCFKGVEAKHPGIVGNTALENEVEQEMAKICPRPVLNFGQPKG